MTKNCIVLTEQFIIYDGDSITLSCATGNISHSSKYLTISDAENSNTLIFTIKILDKNRISLIGQDNKYVTYPTWEKSGSTDLHYKSDQKLWSTCKSTNAWSYDEENENYSGSSGSNSEYYLQHVSDNKVYLYNVANNSYLYPENGMIKHVWIAGDTYFDKFLKYNDFCISITVNESISMTPIMYTGTLW
ncbi:hypothetical protein CG015_01720 [Vibrio anguillarum]|uniref:hypothetical protein n=1 Tax=Vibrio anguillarum TaxID=55601 RepID=UPI000B7BF5A2|nr:hypothetical protein [Vibrio anguillarum]ASO28111.1 hypothetical protein CG015_01720 [Vibrio anguillarum]